MKFSIITCTYNSAGYLQNNIDSVKNQTFQDFEHVFIDGFSSDNTMDIIREYQMEFPAKVTVLQFKPNGISDAMNKGIEASSGEYINHLHSDDSFYDNNVLEKVAKAIDSNKNPELVYGKAKFIEESSSLERIIPHRKIYHKMRFWLLLLTDYIPHQATFIRKEVFEKYGMFDMQYKNRMDYDMWLRLSQKNISSKFIDEIICNFSLRNESQSVIGRYNNEHEKVFAKYINNSVLRAFLNFLANINKRRNLFK